MVDPWRILIGSFCPHATRRLRLTLTFIIFIAVLSVLALDSADDGLAEWEEGANSPEQTMESGQPAQMTEAWWDLHYRDIFVEYNLSGDPRAPGTMGGDLTDQGHFDATLECVQSLLASLPGGGTRGGEETCGPAKGPKRRRPKVLVLGCGLSPLVFVLADKGGLDVICLDISKGLINQLEVAGWQLPRSPRFVVGDEQEQFAQLHLV